MKLKSVTGREISKNVDKYRINWDKKSRSNYQFKFKQFLKNHIFCHVVFEEFPIFGSRMTLDLYDATTKIAYEVQGEQHNAFSKHFHNNSRLNYLDQIKRDIAKLNFCESNNIKLVEVYPDDLKNLSPEWFKEKFDVEL